MIILSLFAKTTITAAVRVTNMEVLKVGRNKKAIPQYGTVKLNGIEYYRTRIEDADEKELRSMQRPQRNL